MYIFTIFFNISYVYLLVGYYVGLKGRPLDFYSHRGYHGILCMPSLVQVINFATVKRGNIHGKAWIFPRLSGFFPVETISSQ